MTLPVVLAYGNESRITSRILLGNDLLEHDSHTKQSHVPVALKVHIKALLLIRVTMIHANTIKAE